jgi:hypothetical protein
MMGVECGLSVLHWLLKFAGAMPALQYHDKDTLFLLEEVGGEQGEPRRKNNSVS